MQDKQNRNVTGLGYKAIKVFMLFAIVFILFYIPYSHISFQKRVVALMEPAVAESLSLLMPGSASSPIGPNRVLIAISAEGQFEYRSSYPIIGQVPFDPFGSGVTSVNLLAECKRLGERACNFWPQYMQGY